MTDIDLENKDNLTVSKKESNTLRNIKDFQILISIQLVLFIIFMIAVIRGYNNNKPYYKLHDAGGGGYWDYIEPEYLVRIHNTYLLYILAYAFASFIFLTIKRSPYGWGKSLVSLVIGFTLGFSVFRYLNDIFEYDKFQGLSEIAGEEYIGAVDDKLNTWLVSAIVFIIIYFISLDFYIRHRKAKTEEFERMQKSKAKEFERMQKSKAKEFSDFFASSEQGREFAQKFVNTRISLIKQSMDTLTPQNINTHVRSILTQDIDKLNQLFKLNELPVFPRELLINYCYDLTKPFRADFKKILKDHLTASLLEGDSKPLSEDDEVSKLIDDLLEKYEHMETEHTGKE
ncbi:MAG: hypothetical protein ACXAD7_08805 [Candidatus Kariarchaeaceae archaeon]|jgi:hypothetical protein